MLTTDSTKGTNFLLPAMYWPSMCNVSKAMDWCEFRYFMGQNIPHNIVFTVLCQQ